jgi:Fe-S-cluster-containing dehydrogenase component
VAKQVDKRSRREALIGMATGAAGGLLASTSILAAPRQSEYGLLIDTTLCKYCKECIKACEAKRGDGTPGTFYVDVELTYPRGKERGALAVPFLCLHCIDPPCVTVCQGGALQKTALGPVTLDDNKCIGCLSCLSVCPFERCIHYQSIPVKFFKCDMCYDRIAEGKPPACVDACEKARYDALIFGPFSEILQQGRQRAEEMGGILLYPEETNILLLFREEEFNEPLMAELFGFSRTYSHQAQAKATITQMAHLGWLPLVGGTYFYLRKKRSERLAHTEKEED